MTELEALKERHSVRKYIDRQLDNETIEKLQDKISILNEEGDLHLQLVVNEPKAFSGGIFSYGKFSGVSNYIMVIGKDSDKLDYNAGYFGQCLVLFAQQLGLRTCWVGLTYKKIAGAFSIASGERVACCIAIGYGADNGVQHKSKRPDRVSNVSTTTPEWFANGVDAALLAPTAVNQQKFRFTYIPANNSGEKPKVRAEKGFSIVGYTKIDLGIAMCNFEIGAGKDNFDWEK